MPVRRACSPRGRDRQRRRVPGLDDDIEGAADPVADGGAAALEGDLSDRRLRRVAIRRERARPQRVDDRAAALLREVHVRPRLRDVPDHRAVRGDALPRADAGDDVPVLEGDAARPVDDHGVVRVQRMGARDAVEGRVDGGPVRRRDVDPEVDAVALARDPRVAEVAADGMLLVERLDRPAVRREGRRRGRERDERGRDGCDMCGGGHAATVRRARNGDATAM